MTEHNEEEQQQVSQSATEQEHHHQQQQQQPNPEEDEEHEEFKIYIGRVPTKFTEDTVKLILVDKLGGEAAAEGGNGGDDDAAVVVAVAIVEKVELIYPHDDETGDNHNNKNNNKNKNHPEGYRADRAGDQTNHDKRDKRETTTKDDANANADREHRGFGFVSFSTAAFRDAALKLGTIKGGRKRTSKRLYTMHLRPYVPIADANTDANAELSENGRGESDARPTGRDVCHLWSLKRCPYGNECKFRHVGEGGCLRREEDLTPEEQKQLRRKRKGKCFVYKKKGRCPKGDDCPFSHDFEPDVKARTGDSETKSGSGGGGACVAVDAVPKSEKDCINWKTKGKCRKGDKCPYKHDPEVQKRALEKIAKKKKRQRDGEGGGDDSNDQKRRRKEKQPLSVRVFGLNYDTTEKDVREFVQSMAGHPVKTIVFPRFEDSGRSKGYCGVYFASPKAAKDAVAKCDGAELQGRWLRVQTGKSMTVDQWEGLHHK
mmetsp:Transcript_2108/g.5581  ORF Transcript_2108/g.5581 Transcript_2108/m.5581 type:complete len:487 (-) Transcript_2108:119-1579(-)